NTRIKEHYSEQKKKGNVSILAIGKRGSDYFSRQGFSLIGDHNELFAQLNFENSSVITEQIMKGFIDGDYDRVDIIYNQFKNAAVQFLATEQLLPLQTTVDRDVKENQTETDY